MIVLYVGPIFGLAMVAGALYACFSIYGFYYKTWRGGKRLKSCPQWEPLQQLMPPPPLSGSAPWSENLSPAGSW